ncbi:tetratricopeptide repeat-containing sensor histidine kinase [Chitinophaga silvisoli]|uniref:histidine kinase n=1 Tax=Chitinophaga silvisoli TaxID=2291814 RepID=A0A3E1NRX2_9BACT|nr:histidine kinase dimerization/phosphoacceptor domain -containing protein [Chitinophaga silvisoli]RFM30676.1 hypothetical protein DXN04_32560 [Chitinophaga silvisoli]
MTKPNASSKIVLLISFLLLNSYFLQAQQAPTVAMLNRQLQQCHTDTGRTNVLQQLAALYINKPGIDPEDIRWATGYASQALAISTKQHYPDGQAGSLTLLAQIAREKGDTSKAREYIDKALAFASNAAPWPAMAAAYQEKAIQLGIYEAPQLKVHYYSLYLEQLKQHEQRSLKLADALKYYGDVLIANWEFARARHYLKQSLDIYQALHYTKLQDLYSLLGSAEHNLENFREALKYLLLAQKQAEEDHDTTAVMYGIYNRMGSIYAQVEQFKEATIYEEKAYKVAARLHDQEAMALFACNLAATYNEIHDFGKAQRIINKGFTLIPANRPSFTWLLRRHQFALYTMSHDYTRAMAYLPQANAMIDNPVIDVAMRQGVASKAFKMFLEIKNYTLAEKYLHKMEALAALDNTVLVKKSVEKHRFTLDSLRGNCIAAIRHYQRFMALSDSMEMVKRDRQLAQLKIEYETEQKDRDLELKEKHISLLIAETSVQKELIKHEATRRHYSYAIGALLLLLLMISSWAYNIKRRANLQLKQQQFEINQQNITLKELLEDRDCLLKEVHHRVKNNLQIVISLLNTQALHLDNETARQALRESRNRMQAISIIHQKLYQSDSFSGVNMHYYLNELLEYLQDSFSIHDMITVETNPDFTELDVSQAVPIGLIINEAVTNAIKYALPSTAQPHIHISLRCEDEQVAVSIADNGPGFPADFDPDTSTSFGLNLIIGLVRQLRGKVEFDSSAGLHIKLSFQQSRILV